MSENGKQPIQSDGWKQWSEQVKESMTKLEDKVDKLENKITKHREEALVDITTLKVKAGIMGMIAGFVTSTIMSIIVGLIVYQLTIGAYNPNPTPHKHEVPTVPYQTEEPIGYYLPPSNSELRSFMDKEGDV